MKKIIEFFRSPERISFYSNDALSKLKPTYFYNSSNITPKSFDSYVRKQQVDQLIDVWQTCIEVMAYIAFLKSEIKRLELKFSKEIKYPKRLNWPSGWSIDLHRYIDILSPSFYPERYSFFGDRIDIHWYKKQWEQFVNGYGAIRDRTLNEIYSYYEELITKENELIMARQIEDQIIEEKNHRKTKIELGDAVSKVEELKIEIGKKDAHIKQLDDEVKNKRAIITTLEREKSFLREQIKDVEIKSNEIIKAFTETHVESLRNAEAKIVERDREIKLLSSESSALRQTVDNLSVQLSQIIKTIQVVFDEKILTHVFDPLLKEMDISKTVFDETNRVKEELEEEKTHLELNKKLVEITSLKKETEIAEQRIDLKIKEKDLKKEQKIVEVQAKINELGQVKNEVIASQLGLAKVEMNIEHQKNVFGLEQQKFELNSERQEFKFEQFKFELEKDKLSFEIFVAKKELEFQQSDLLAKTRLVEMAEKINILEAKNLESERIKLETVNKLAEIGLMIREQNVQIQSQLNEVEKRKIQTEAQLVQFSLEKGSVKLMLEKLEVDAQKKVNEVEGLLLQVKDGQFKNSVNEQLQLLNQKAIENQVTMQLIGLTQRENLVDLKNERLTNVDYYNRIQMGLKEMQFLQKQNSLQSQLESERIAHENQQQNLYSRIGSIQNQLERSQIDLAGERALRKYLS